ncbi:serine/threonine-protein kinase EDR1-like isoform X1 [Zingiber officinale]|uniref:serine/threonine-protein kinase EDR1-like isoform X1 n=1 Tax=Zingiber officinale TaxID=94328 RepID=UPI001C4C35A3|nr:serine/threonine-protein kinase EDR1-like isoform X1 [Zingiber officinale]
MKNIFKKRSHHRPNEVPSASSTVAAQSPAAAVSPLCASDLRDAASATSPTTPQSSVEPPRTTSSGDDWQDYFSSEEEFQVQLALAISASNSELKGDLDGDQIRAAKLLSLGRERIQQDQESSAELLSRRYWDYNVLDYDEKIVDGFYDVYGLSGNSASQKRMPSLTDLQTSIGDLGFEVIVVNRAIDPALVELEQIAQCILLGCPTADIAVLVQRISELVMGHMGGRVRDANDMLAKWMERSTELRSTQQTSLLPIGCIKVGLSRHRALLFKVLADNIGIPCRLVKGSHYTGVDDDAINIINLDEREFLVDLMAAPGTLIPADVLSLKNTSSNPSINISMNSWSSIPEDDFFKDKLLNSEFKGHNAVPSLGDIQTVDKRTRYENSTWIPSVQSDHNGESSTSNGSTSGGSVSLLSIQDEHDQTTSTSITSSKQKGIVVAASIDGNNWEKRKANAVLNPQDALDVTNLFADLNPFRGTLGAKAAPHPKATDSSNSGYQRRKENIAVGPGRSQVPLVWKGRSACNEISSTKQKILESSNPQKNFVPQTSSSKMPSSAAKSSSTSTNVAGFSVIVNSLESQSSSTSIGMGYGSPEYARPSKDSEKMAHHYLYHQTEKTFENLVPSAGKNLDDNVNKMVSLNSHLSELQEQKTNVAEKQVHQKPSHDRCTETNMNTVDEESPSFPAVSPSIYEESSNYSQVQLSKLDPVLDDVANWEIPWEELVVGERIGLGSYGEVYRADWNGAEVAVKKFLDQDFYGDALDEFRSEIRIMRRLRHPNVVLFMGAVTRPPNLSIVSEFLPRGSLYRILHRPNCQIDEKRRIKMALDVAMGMNCLHTSVPTIVHRDLKSPNLLVNENWTVKVCDFGLSRLKHSTFLSSKSTAGTPEWMAPEVLRNENSNEKSDVYSFGVILWELATLRMPWSGMNPMQVVGAVGFQNQRLEIPKEVDPLVARIIWECWQMDPSLRPSFAQLTTVLKSLQRLIVPSHQELQNPPMPQKIPVNSIP